MMKLEKSNTPIHIIYLIHFSPKYEYEEEEKLKKWAIYDWTNKQNQFMGIWKEDGAIQRGLFLLEHYPNITWEVWRPDIRADEVYEHDFENGVIHKSFPVVFTRSWDGLFYSKALYSPLMEKYLSDCLNKYPTKKIILIIPAARKPFSFKLQKRFRKKIPILNVRSINNNTLIAKYKFKIEPAKMIRENVRILQTQHYMNKTDYLLCAHNKYTEEITKKYNCKVFINPHFEDVNFWNPIISKDVAREKLNLSSDKIVLFSSSRLVPEYQLDRIIEILGSFNNYDFLYFISGNGDDKYKQLLMDKIRKYKLEKKVLFLGFIEGETLRNYYLAADVFISTCILNSCPRSTNKALLLGVPILSTDSGFGAEYLKSRNCGIVIPPKFKYEDWHEGFKKIFNRTKISIPPLDEVIETFRSEKIASNWMNMFKEIISNHYNK